MHHTQKHDARNQKYIYNQKTCEVKEHMEDNNLAKTRVITGLNTLRGGANWTQVEHLRAVQLIGHR